MDFGLLIGTLNLLAIAALAFFILRGRRNAPSDDRQLIDSLGRLERLLREEQELARAGAEDRARLLREELNKSFGHARQEGTTSVEALRIAIQASVTTQGADARESLGKLAEAQTKTIDGLVAKVRELSELTDKRLLEMRVTLEAKLAEATEIVATRLTLSERAQVESGTKLSASLNDPLVRMNDANEQRGERLRETVSLGLQTLRTENEAKLEQIRKTVDEQLQGTLEKRLGESFGIVTEHLQKVALGLGEMQQLANGFTDIKRVLTNVRPRGIWGEAQLESILSDFLAADQFERNVRPNPNSSEVVEFAIKLPRPDERSKHYYIAVDSKFPREDFERLIVAADAADPDAVRGASEGLSKAIKKAATDIKTKYICPPHTADFAIMFLPSEGLYAEVARQNGLIESIGRETGVMVAGPSNLMAHLSAVRVGFRSLAIQEQAGEIANILQRVQTEFGKYDAAVEKALKRANSTVTTLSDLQTRQRQMGRAPKERRFATRGHECRRGGDAP